MSDRMCIFSTMLMGTMWYGFIIEGIIEGIHNQKDLHRPVFYFSTHVSIK